MIAPILFIVFSACKGIHLFDGKLSPNGGTTGTTSGATTDGGSGGTGNPTSYIDCGSAGKSFLPASRRSPSQLTLTVKNNGIQTVNFYHAQFSDATNHFRYRDSLPFPGAGGTCGGDLTPGATCTIALEFAPLGVSQYTIKHLIRYALDNGNTLLGELDCNLQGQGMQPGSLVNVVHDSSPTGPFTSFVGQTDTTSLLLGGHKALTLNGSQYLRATVQKVSTTGGLVTSFGTNGTLEFTVDPNEEASRVYFITPRTSSTYTLVGTYVGATSRDLRIFFARMKANGTLDTTFATNGIKVLSNVSLLGSQWSNPPIRRDGNTLYLAHGMTVGAYSLDGDPITTFGSNGQATIPAGITSDIAFSYSMSVSSDHNIYIGVSSMDSNQVRFDRVVRFNQNGAQDLNFAATGILEVTDLTGTGDSHGLNVLYGMSVLARADGTLVVGGMGRRTALGTQYQYIHAIACQFDNNGDVDTSFGPSISPGCSKQQFTGVTYQGVSYGWASFYALSETNDGYLHAGGFPAVTRLMPNGSADSSFAVSSNLPYARSATQILPLLDAKLAVLTAEIALLIAPSLPPGGGEPPPPPKFGDQVSFRSTVRILWQ